MGENYSESEWAALSDEERAEALRIEKSVRDFLGDRKAIRYIESQGNHDALLDFLSTHGLDITHRNRTRPGPY